MQFEVPQFIEIEDKIFGPFTWRQFLYLGGGGGMVVVIFLLLPFYIAIIPAGLIGAFTAALAFYPINNRPFSDFLEAMYNHYRRNRLYLWQQTRSIVHKQSFTPTTSVSSRLPLSPINNQKKDITSLARRLELQALQKKNN
jgi:PrgI family protein